MYQTLFTLLILTAVSFAQDPMAYAPSSAASLQPLEQHELDAARNAFTQRQPSAVFLRTPQAVADDPASRPVISAFFAMGVDGARRYVPAIAITNNSSVPVDVVLELIGRDGRPLAVPFKDANGRIARYTGASGTIEPGAEVSPMLADIVETVRYGYLRVTSDLPESLAVKSFTTAIESTRFGVFAHPAVHSSPLTHQVGIENSPRIKQTMLSIVNPSDEPVNLTLTARRFNGREACAPLTMELAPGAQIWRTAQSLITCVKSGEDNYNLYIEPVDGEVAVQAYYDYGTLVFANAPVHQLEPTSMVENAAKNPMQTKAAVAATCVPTFDPLKPRLTSDEQTIELEIDFDKCNPDQTWVIKTAASWYYFVDGRNREVASLSGAGSATITVRINAAPARRSGGNRYGYLYLYSTANGRQGKRLVTYSFSQPVPRP